MHLWLLIIGTLFLQEQISTSLVVLQAFHAGYSPLIISLLWLAIATFQIVVGYALGKYIRGRLAHSKVDAVLEKYSLMMRSRFGSFGEGVLLIFLTILTLPFITGLLAVWMDISLSTILIFCLIGDAIWYATIWIQVLSANAYASTFQEATVGILIVSLAISFAIGAVGKKNNSPATENTTSK